MKKLLITVLSWMCVTAGAFAFPSWIGVYGGEVRHADSANPGTYTILLNQDYTGLHAEVGVQVNSGAWTVYQMTYAGKKDTNSKWTYTPTTGYPAGATVRYYFHGWDDWGGNIWDSNSGANYSFAAVGNSNTIQFNNPQNLGYSGPSEDVIATATSGTSTFAYTGDSLNRGTLNNATITWSGWQGAAVGQTIAANGSLVVVAGSSSSDSTKLAVSRSTDGGATFGLAQTLNVDGQQIITVSIATRGSEVVIACITSPGNGDPTWVANGLWSLKSSDNGQTWGAPVRVDTVQDMGGFAGVRIDANSSRYFIIYGYNRQVYESNVKAATSTTGDNWSTAYVFSNKSPNNGALVVTSSGAFIAMDGYYNNVISLARWDGLSWSSQLTIPHPNGYESGRSVFLGARNNELYLFRADAAPAGTWSVMQSTDNGATWIAVGSLTPPQGVPNFTPSLQQVISKDGRIHLTWVNGDWRYGSNFWQFSIDSGGTGLQWVGNTYAYPANGTVTSLDDLWINAETWQIAPGQSVSLSYRVYANGIFESKPMDWSYNDANNSHWHVNLGKFPAGMIVEYFVVARQGGTTLYDNNSGQNYSVTVAAAPVQWAGNVYNWPLNGQIKSTDDFWVNIESWPAGTATSARVVYSTDGVNWFSVDLTRNGTAGSNDAWHANLGKFASRKTIQYAIEVKDGTNKSMWANNNGANYRATVN